MNAGSGSVLGDETARSLRERFIAYGLRANVHLATSGAEIVVWARHAAKSDAEMVVAGGGATVVVGAGGFVPGLVVAVDVVEGGGWASVQFWPSLAR